MFEESRIIFLYAETSFHPGSGDSIVGVDLPIQRERHTNYPKNQGSGVKGAIRDLTKGRTLAELKKLFAESINCIEHDLAKEKAFAELDEIFGPANASHQGAVSLTEARILLFPVKSLKGVFSWITCPFVIERFKRDLKRMNSEFSGLDNIQILSVPDKNALVTDPCVIKTTTANAVVLEDLAFDADDSQTSAVNKLAKWFGDNALRNDDSYTYWKEKLKNSLAVVSDEVFRDFVVYYTEVSTRHKRSETGTVEEGALWNEETLPSETLMYSGLLATRSNKKGSALSAAEVIEKVENVLNESKFIQMGASETVGQGFLGIRCFQPMNSIQETVQTISDKDKSGQANSTQGDQNNVKPL